MGPIETNANYPLSSEPAEGYGADPATRTGKVILTNALNGRFIIVTADGFEHTNVRAEATKFDNHSDASIKAGALVTAAKAKAKAEAAERVEAQALA